MENSNNNLIHQLDNESENNYSPYKILVVFLIVLITGVLTGFVITRLNLSSGSEDTKEPAKKVIGVTDKKTFKDSATGILKTGGIDGEGSYHLERVGGESQNAYLTSSAVDLSQFVGKKVRVWGETFKGEKAGWLMDVGLVEVL